MKRTETAGQASKWQQRPLRLQLGINVAVTGGPAFLGVWVYPPVILILDWDFSKATSY